jgi:hypothetical protein
MQFAKRFFRRGLHALAVAALVSSIAACDGDSTGTEDEPNVASVRVTVGAQTVTISNNGTQTGTLTVPQGNSAVTVAWLRPNGTVESLVTSDEFNVRMTAAAGTSGVTFTSSGAFGGTLNATSAGQKVLRLSLFHLEEQHEDFGPLNLTLTVS